MQLFCVVFLGLLFTSAQSQAGLCPVISVQPQGLSIPMHATATISVVASRAGTHSYKWYRNGRRVGGANGSVLVLSNVTSRVAGTYHVEIRNSSGTTVSSNAVLTVLRPPLMITGTKMTPTGLQIRLDNLTVASCVIYTSSDLVNWKAVSTNRVSSGTVVYTDPSALAHPICFYKAREHTVAQSRGNHGGNSRGDEDDCDQRDDDSDDDDHDNNDDDNEDRSGHRDDRNRSDDR